MAEVLAGLRRCGFVEETDRILLQDTVINRYANVIYDLGMRAPALEIVQGFLNASSQFTTRPLRASGTTPGPTDPSSAVNRRPEKILGAES